MCTTRQLPSGGNGGGGGGSTCGRRSFHSQSSSASSSSPSNSQPTQSSRRWLHYAWIVHFVSSIVMMTIGMWNNHLSRKYIPISSSDSLSSTMACERAFLNVMSPSITDAGSVVCCEGTDWEGSGGYLDICPSETYVLPLAARLSRFPEAWLLPLFPLLLRILYIIYRIPNCYFSTSYSLLPASDSTSHLLLMPTLRRLGFYILLFNFRGWVLYVAFNAIEDSIVTPMDSSCWYRDWLRPEQPDCVGRVFDFSDHIVLYFAQILPIALVEFLHAWEQPYYWTERSLSTKTMMDYALSRIVPVTLIGGILYLYVITFLGVYKTAYYFHTPPEVAAGWVVSLVVQLPLHCMQCSDYCESAREYLFGANNGKSHKVKIPMP